MNAKFERRTLLGGTLAALATTAAGPAWAASGRSAPAPGFWHQPSKLNRQDRVFLHRGLTHGAWVRSGPQDGWYPSAKLLNGAGFAMPQFYAEHLAESAQHKLLYSADVLRGLHHPTWALARAPFGEQNLTKLPDPQLDWMSRDMKKNAHNLFTVCFGDEENFSAELRDYLAGAMEKLRRDHPWVLTHTNQWSGEFSEAQLTDYVRTVKPDLLTWDGYSWMAGGSATSSNTELYRRIEQYRRFALAGPDGTGSSPLTFGQYTIGFRMSPPPQPGVSTFNQRRVFISESQQNLFPYMTWAGGGKWLSLFRWELDEDYYNPVNDVHWETDGLFMTDADENPLPAYYRYQRINRDMRTFSPYLVRMRSRATPCSGDTSKVARRPRRCPD